MNKFAVVLGVAAVVTLAGCKNPKMVKGTVDEKVDVVGETPVQQPPEEVQTPPPAIIVTTPAQPENHCKCPPGTKHAEPCGCGAPDCKCVVVAKPIAPVPPPAPEYTVYIVQRGDYLAKISKKYNLTIASIKRLNNLSGDTIRIGQKLKLPGKIEVGEQTVPAPTPVVKSTKASVAVTPYAGATKDYVVKNGDTLGAIAYGNGIKIRQLKELNGLVSDSLKVGQKLKVPAAKPAKPVVAKKTSPAVEKSVSAVAVKADAAAVAAPAQAEPADAAEPAEKPEAEVDAEAAAPVAEEKNAAAAAKTNTYTVQEGDDITGVSIRWGVTAAAIRDLNNLPEDAQLKPGQVLKLPADAQQ